MEVFSPNHPNNYDPNMNCTWSFVSEEWERKIQLTFDDFSVGPGKQGSCFGDFLQVDEPGEASEHYCEYSAVHGIPIRSKGNNLTIKFYSDEINEDKGFKLSYKTIGNYTCIQIGISCTAI